MQLKIMPRLARITAIGYPHHVTQRGNYRQRVFKTNNDYKQYLSWLNEYSEKNSLDIWAYCLMPNHVHFICVPQKIDSLARTFNTLHMRYSQYMNKKQGACGHLWQGRFFSCILDEKHLFAAVRYVENNPVRAGIVKSQGEYHWSSAKGHINKGGDLILCKKSFLHDDIEDWLSYLNSGEDNNIVECIRKKTRVGQPYGEDGFMIKLEKKLGMKLSKGKPGRPRKVRVPKGGDK
ncbi:MAG: transposase [Deltaproteobacteria bacterium]|nr:transposase [Deltaproteobacteria bacterium]